MSTETWCMKIPDGMLQLQASRLREQLAGAIVQSVLVSQGTLVLVFKNPLRGGKLFAASVLRDEEGNGPGYLDVIEVPGPTPPARKQRRPRR